MKRTSDFTGHRGAHHVGARGDGCRPATGAHAGLGALLGHLGCHHGQVDHLPEVLGGSRRPGRRSFPQPPAFYETVALTVSMPSASPPHPPDGLDDEDDGADTEDGSAGQQARWRSRAGRAG